MCGSNEGLMVVTGRRHNTDDIIATVLAVEPMKFIYRGRFVDFMFCCTRLERCTIKVTSMELISFIDIFSAVWKYFENSRKAEIAGWILSSDCRVTCGN